MRRTLSAMAFGAMVALVPDGPPVGAQGREMPDGEMPDGGALATVTGVRATRGGGVECPALRDDAGVLHPVSYLPPRIAVGDRVTVRGTLAITTACRGVVLVVEALVGENAGDGDGAVGGR